MVPLSSLQWHIMSCRSFCESQFLCQISKKFKHWNSGKLYFMQFSLKKEKIYGASKIVYAMLSEGENFDSQILHLQFDI